ncbi:MAG: type IV conjugative transfer system coupling protein TraD [Proteobacteria bacterium]|nr:type IV conjugative transfer system coupling protein TraD [Pseudomonadota bacterium]
MGDFVRGGQVSIHTIRMYKQVFAFMWSFAIITLITVPAIYSLMKTDSFDRQVLLAYTIARLKVEYGKSDENIRIELPDGATRTFRSIDFVNDDEARYRVGLVWHIIEEGFLYTLGLLLGGSLFVTFYFNYKGRKLGKPSHVRGGNIKTPKQLTAQIKKDNRFKKVKPYKLAGIPYPAYTESQHTFITGSPGAGKTVVLSDLIKQIKARGDRAIIYDKMGSYVKSFYDEEKDVIMNPLDARSVSWSVFNEARNQADFDTIAEALLPSEKGNVDPFWTNAARVLFSNVCCCLHANGTGSNRHLLQNILKTDLSRLAKLIKGTPAQAIIDEQSPKTALSVMSVLSTYVGAMKYLKDAGDSFSIRKWISDDAVSNFLFVTSRADQHSSLRPLISLWLDIAINALLSLEQSRDRKIWIILDELPSLQYLPSLQSGLAESRQFGGAFVLALQVMPQLQSIYGKEMARATSGLCQTRMVFKSSDNETAAVGAESLGRSEVEDFKEGLSYGAHEMRDGINISTHTNLKPLILPTEVMNLKNLEAYIRFGMDYPIAKVKVQYKSYKQISPKYIPYDGDSLIEEEPQEADQEQNTLTNPEKPKERKVINKENNRSEIVFELED